MDRQDRWERQKKRTQAANTIRKEQAEKDKLEREAKQRRNQPRQEKLRAKALGDTHGFTGEFTERKGKRKRWLRGKRP